MSKVNAETFVRIWQSSSSLEEVMQRSGYKTKTDLWRRANTIRKLGVPLKRFSYRGRGRPKLDVEELKRIAAETLK